MIVPARTYWFAFSRILGLPAPTIHAMRRTLGGLQEIIDAPPEELLAFPRVTPGLVRKLKRITPQKLTAWDAALDELELDGVRVLCPDDDSYPEGFEDLSAPPKILYLRGDLPLSRKRCVSIIGTREATAVGRELAAELARELARAGAWVISGLARGIDGAAHRGALEGGGPTLAFLGSGVRRPSPAGHRELAEEILQLGGGLASELLPDHTVSRTALAARNRLIVAVSAAVCVVESGLGGGSFISVRRALELERPLLAVDWGDDEPAHQGNRWLIEHGAAAPLPAAGAGRALRELLAGGEWPRAGLGGRMALAALPPAGRGASRRGRRARRGAGEGWP